MLFPATKGFPLLEAFVECRNCNHWHYNLKSYCGSHVIKGGTIWTLGSHCFCTETVPKDNLEYLEYLYEKKVNK